MRQYISSLLLTIILLSASNIQSQDLIINEVMSSNQQFLQDELGETPDWIELRNNSTQDIFLGAYSIGTKFNPQKAWPLPLIDLQPGQYILLFASGKDIRETPIYWHTLVDEGDTWRYYLPHSEPSSNWKKQNFNDLNWATGASGFGYGDDDDNTVIASTPSIYLRKTFLISNKDSIATAFFHIDYDDAFVAYLNGVEFARGNITSNGDPRFDAVADLNTHEAVMYSGGTPERFDLPQIRDMLVDGENTLAVHVINAGINSSDLSAIPFLTLGHQNRVSESIASFIDIPGTRYHTDFKISAAGENLYLFKNNLYADSVNIGPLPSNISFGRSISTVDEWFYYEQPTPEAPNTGTAYTSLTGPVDFSIKGGIFSESITLTLSSASTNDKIFFTTDNTEPTVTDHLYSVPISISNTTQLRARILNPDAMKGPVSSQSYLYNISHNLPIISLITNPDDFFDYNEGIYVAGPYASSAMPHYGANYWQEWEKPIHVSMMTPDGTLAFEQNAGVKIFGGWSRASAQKSLSLRFRKRYGADGLDYKVFEELDLNKFYSLNLRNSGNDWNNTMLRDGVLTSLFPKSIGKQAFQASVVYLNGEYWGIHNIRERIDKYYIQEHYKIPSDEVNIMEFHADNFLQLVEGDDQHYLNMLDFMRSNNLSDSANYSFVMSQMNVENFAMYMASNIYIDNTDWPGNNIKFWRADAVDSKWNWLAYDTDFGFKNLNNNTLTFAMADNRTTHPNPAEATLVLRSLNTNENFRNLFINVFADQLNTQWLPSEVDLVIEKMKNTISDEIPRHFERWGGNAFTWANRVNSLSTFAAARPAVVYKFIQNYYELTGKYTLRLTLSNNNHGTIRLNTIHPQSYPWYGYYFKNIPIKLTAIPKQGYRFVRWEGASTSLNDSITLDADRNSWVKAIFEVDESITEQAVVINEVYYKKTGTSSPNDWVEIANRSSHSVDISDWLLKDNKDDHTFKIPKTTILQANGFLVLCKDLMAYKTYYPYTSTHLGELDFGFSEVSDCVRLYNQHGNLMDSVFYENPNPMGVAEFSYQRLDYSENWQNFTGIGTPEKVNAEETVLRRTEQIDHFVTVFPNPFKDKLSLTFELKNTSHVSIQLISQNGITCGVLASGSYSQGLHGITWQAEQPLPQGIYLLLIQTDEYVMTKKVVHF